MKKFSCEYKKIISHIFFFFFCPVLVYYKMVEFTRNEYDIISKNRGITEPQKMTTQDLINTLNR